MGSTSPQLNFLNRRPAAQTRLACFSIDLVFFLHGTILSEGIAIGANSGATLFNSLSKHSNRFFADYFGFSSSQALTQTGWMNLGSIKDLIHIDIAQTSH